jgi:hypothetical protein
MAVHKVMEGITGIEQQHVDGALQRCMHCLGLPALALLRMCTGEVEEAVREEQQALEAELMRLLRLLDVSVNHGAATGWLHKADVKTALAGFFKGKKVRASLTFCTGHCYCCCLIN